MFSSHFGVPRISQSAAFLSQDRIVQLEGKFLQRQAAEDALAAVNRVEDHPSRSLIERLIADGAVCQTMYRHWDKLVSNDAKWENLLFLCEIHGAEKLEAKLRDVYGLTAGAAEDMLKVFAAESAIGAFVFQTFLFLFNGCRSAQILLES